MLIHRSCFSRRPPEVVALVTLLARLLVLLEVPLVELPAALAALDFCTALVITTHTIRTNTDIHFTIDALHGLYVCAPGATGPC
jgi:hypothetical protein